MRPSRRIVVERDIQPTFSSRLQTPPCKSPSVLIRLQMETLHDHDADVTVGNGHTIATLKLSLPIHRSAGLSSATISSGNRGFLYEWLTLPVPTSWTSQTHVCETSSLPQGPCRIHGSLGACRTRYILQRSPSPSGADTICQARFVGLGER
jgi:hypothetical protein